MKSKLEFRGATAQYSNGKVRYHLGNGFLQPLPKLPDCQVTVCAWCDPDKKLTRLVESAGYQTSHGICQKCSDGLKPPAVP